MPDQLKLIKILIKIRSGQSKLIIRGEIIGPFQWVPLLWPIFFESWAVIMANACVRESVRT